MFPKIHVYPGDGTGPLSTTWAETCREAVQNFLATRPKWPHKVTARFAVPRVRVREYKMYSCRDGRQYFCGVYKKLSLAKSEAREGFAAGSNWRRKKQDGEMVHHCDLGDRGFTIFLVRR